ncbi:MAG: sugar phosphate isomerase/epimerase, partial [bacterium]
PIFGANGVTASSVRKALRDTGLGCTISSVMPQDSSLIAPDPKARQRGVDFLRYVLDLGGDIGAEVLCGPHHSPVGHLEGRGRTDEEWRWCVDSLSKVAPHAESAHVLVAIEPLNRFETYFLNIASDVYRLVNDVGSKAIGIHFDTFHANIEEKNPVEALRACGDRLYHFHCSENDRGPVGTGHVDWKGMLGILREMQYNRWLVVESFLPAIKEIAAAAAIWRELSPSPEALSSDSLAFLRKIAES